MAINSMMSDALFGSSNSIGAGSFLSASNFGDLALIKSGVYTKMMRSYISKMTDDSDSGTSTRKTTNSEFRNMVSEKLEQIRTKETPTVQDTENKALSSVKSTSKSLETASKELSGMDFDQSTREELFTAAKSFVSSYNSLLTSAGKTDNVSVTQSVTWMKNDTKAHEKLLGKIGVTIGKDGSLALDEEKFKAANLSDIRLQMSGSSSIVGKTAQRATGLVNLASNQISYKSGSSLYSSQGIYK